MATTRPRRLGALAALCGIAVVPSGCITSTDIETIDEIAGLWVASNAIYSELADPTNRFDLIAEGFDVTMQIEENGEWALLLIGQGFAGVQGGTMAVDGKLLLITTQGADTAVTEAGRVYLEGEQAAIQILGEDQEWDFDGDGTAEPAKLNLVMDRQP
jgi:hypothetical protein